MASPFTTYGKHSICYAYVICMSYEAKLAKIKRPMHGPGEPGGGGCVCVCVRGLVYHPDSSFEMVGPLIFIGNGISGE